MERMRRPECSVYAEGMAAHVRQAKGQLACPCWVGCVGDEKGPLVVSSLAHTPDAIAWPDSCDSLAGLEEGCCNCGKRRRIRSGGGGVWTICGAIKNTPSPFLACLVD